MFVGPGEGITPISLVAAPGDAGTPNRLVLAVITSPKLVLSPTRHICRRYLEAVSIGWRFGLQPPEDYAAQQFPATAAGVLVHRICPCMYGNKASRSQQKPSDSCSHPTTPTSVAGAPLPSVQYQTLKRQPKVLLPSRQELSPSHCPTADATTSPGVLHQQERA